MSSEESTVFFLACSGFFTSFLSTGVVQYLHDRWEIRYASGVPLYLQNRQGGVLVDLPPVTAVPC